MTKQKRMAKMEVCKSDLVESFWWRIVGGNGEIMAYSEGFRRRTDARRAMRRAIAIIKGGEFKVVE